jgi:hypothetical protein
MKTKLLMAILAACLIAFSFSQNTFAQQTQNGGQVYLNVQVWNFNHSAVVYPATVWVVDYNGNTLLGPSTNNGEGWASFPLGGFGAGDYIIHALNQAGTIGGTTYWSYSGSGSDNEEVILNINW